MKKNLKKLPPPKSPEPEHKPQFTFAQAVKMMSQKPKKPP